MHVMDRAHARRKALVMEKQTKLEGWSEADSVQERGGHMQVALIRRDVSIYSFSMNRIALVI